MKPGLEQLAPGTGYLNDRDRAYGLGSHVEEKNGSSSVLVGLGFSCMLHLPRARRLFMTRLCTQGWLEGAGAGPGYLRVEGGQKWHLGIVTACSYTP